MHTRLALLMGGILVASASLASAQTWDDKLFVNVSVGTQSGTTDSTVTLSPTIYGEAGSIQVARSLEGKSYFDVSAGRPIAGNFGVVASLTMHASTDDGRLTASIPDPIFFDRPRSVSGAVADMKHTERWIGLQAAWFVPAGEKLDIILMAGPAVAAVKHDALTDARATEGTGGPVVTATVAPQSKNMAGFQLGADVRYMLTDKVGVGGQVTFAKASGSVVAGDKLEVGGLRIGGGVRLRF